MQFPRDAPGSRGRDYGGLIMSTPDGRTTQYRIIIIIEGGAVQSMDGIPMNTVVEVRDYDTDGMNIKP